MSKPTFVLTVTPTETGLVNFNIIKPDGNYISGTRNSVEDACDELFIVCNKHNQNNETPASECIQIRDTTQF